MDRAPVSRPRPRRRLRSAVVETLEQRRLLAAGELVTNIGFETASSGWTASGSWQYGLSGFTNYHGGSKYAFYGNASSGATVDNSTGSLYQTVTIPASMTAPTLTFWSKTTTAETTTTTAYDTCIASIKDSTGNTTLQSLVTISNLNGIGVTSTGTRPAYTATGKYTPYTFAISPALIGQTVRIDFAVSTDGSKGTTFRLDDVSLAEAITPVAGTTQQVVGYLPDYRYTSFPQIDLNRLTHINYFSVGFAADGTLTAPSSSFNSHLDTVVAAAHAKGVGVSITTGPGQPYTTMGASAAARAKLAADLKAYVVAHNLDGVDIDWETPATGANQQNYELLIDALYAQLHPLGKKITSASNPWTKEIPVNASKHMDWINVMCYDFDYANNSTYSASVASMDEWFYYGVAKDKLVMGVPFYGRYGTSWSDTHAVTYPTAISDSKARNGKLPAMNVDTYVNAGGSTVYYNGVTTMQNKMKFLRDNAYAGAFTWELGQDRWVSSVADELSMLPIMSAVVRQGQAPTVPDLDAASDLGWDNTDNITSDTTPTLIGMSWPGAVVKVYDGGVLNGQATADATGAWSYTTGALANGTHTFTATSTFNAVTSIASAARSVVISPITSSLASAPVPTGGVTTLDVAVTLVDSLGAMDVSSIGNSDVTVTGNGWSASGTFIGIDNGANGSPRTATFRITAPGGYWNEVDNGPAVVTLNNATVRNSAGTFNVAQTVGAFAVNIPFAWKSGSVLIAEFLSGGQSIALSGSGTSVTATRGTTVLNLTSVSSITARGTSSVDALSMGGTFTPALTFTSGAGSDTLNISSGTFSIASDFVATAPSLAVTVAAGAIANFNSAQHLRSLTVNGRVNLGSGGSNTLVTAGLTLDPAGVLDVANNPMVVTYTAAGGSPMGTWNGATYTGVLGDIKAGRIISTASPADTIVGAAEASSIITFANGTELKPWRTESVDSTTLLLRRTYKVDATLDGVLNGDDYFRIDSNYPAGAMLWSSGDFDMNGRRDADDYFLLDSVYSRKPVVLSRPAETVTAPAGSGVAELPNTPIFANLGNSLWFIESADDDILSSL